MRYVSAINEERPIEFKRFECNKIIVKGQVRVEEMGDASWYENLQVEIVGKQPIPELFILNFLNKIFPIFKKRLLLK